MVGHKTLNLRPLLSETSLESGVPILDLLELRKLIFDFLPALMQTIILVLADDLTHDLTRDQPEVLTHHI